MRLYKCKDCCAFQSLKVCHHCQIKTLQSRVKELERKNEKLVQANTGADVRVARMESKMIDTEKYIKYLEEELEK